jgi:hypothetical protein
MEADKNALRQLTKGGERPTDYSFFTFFSFLLTIVRIMMITLSSSLQTDIITISYSFKY